MTPVAATNTLSLRHEVVGRQDAVEVVAGIDERLALLVRARPELRLDPAAHALQRAGGDHAFGRAADAVEHVDAGLRTRGRDRGRDVAVANQIHARARLAQLADQLVVAVALEHRDADVGDAPALRLRDGGDVLRGRGVDVDRVDRVGADRDLLHVDRRAGEEQRAALRGGDHGDRVRLPERGQARALERVDRDVDVGAAALADLLAVVEHRRLVLLPLADHDDTRHRDRVEHRPHRVDRRLVGRVLVAAADPAPGAHGRRLGDAHELEREVPVWTGAAHRRLILE